MRKIITVKISKVFIVGVINVSFYVLFKEGEEKNILKTKNK